MTTQFIAGLKKEWMFFGRSLRFLAMLIGFAVAALLTPILSRLMLSMKDFYETAGMGDTIAMFEGESGLFYSYVGSVGMFSMSIMPPLMFVVIALLIGGMAGGEQKKRSIIVPQTAGLTSLGYVLPKFVLFPPLVFVMTLLSMIFANGMCQLLLGMSYPFEVALVTGVLTALSLTFLVSMYMFFGISLAQPGLSIIYVLAANAVFPMINMAFNLDRFTPWSMEGMTVKIIENHVNPEAVGLYAGIGGVNVFLTMLITLALCVVFMLLTHFAMVAKRMDNTADEVY
jgi:hypothetical protein